MTFPTGRGFAQAVTITNPGQDTVAGNADIWRLAQPDFSPDGTILADWQAMFPPGTDLAPMAEVVDVATGRVFWLPYEPDPLASLLTGLDDHVEAHLKSAYRILTTATILRDSDPGDVNALGDDVETTVTVATDVPISITEVALSTPGELDTRTTHRLVGWVGAGVDVQRGDQIVADGITYGVEKVTPPALSTGLRDQRLELLRVT